MAHRIITQVLFTGSRIFGRAVSEAYKQASASQKYAAAGNKSPGHARNVESAGLTLDEACKILDVPPPKQGKADMEKVLEKFKKLFDTNDPQKGGSFYLQSKILRARQRLELEAEKAVDAAERAKQAEGWKPQIYKDK